MFQRFFAISFVKVIIWIETAISIIIFLQNLIRTFISLIISLIFMFILFHMMYCTNEQNHYTINSIFVKYVLPILVLLTVFVVLITSLFPAKLILKTTSVNLLKGRLN